MESINERRTFNRSDYTPIPAGVKESFAGIALPLFSLPEFRQVPQRHGETAATTITGARLPSRWSRHRPCCIIAPPFPRPGLPFNVFQKR